MKVPAPKIILFLGLVATAPASRGALVFRGEQNIVIPNTFGGVYLDVITGETHFSDGLGFNAAQVNFLAGGLGISSSENFLPVRVGTENLDAIRRLAPEGLVDGSLDYGPAGNGASSSHVSNTPGPDQFASGESGYLGFQLDLNDDDTFVFGWMRVTLTNGTGPGVVHEWAYNDVAGEPLAVGVIPEPSSWMLFFLGAGMSLGSRRR